MADHIGRQTVRCEGKDRDRYGRLVAICYLGDEDLDAWMVSQGLALAFRKCSTLYVPQEDAARRYAVPSSGLLDRRRAQRLWRP